MPAQTQGRARVGPLAAGIGALVFVSLAETLLIPWQAFAAQPTLAGLSWLSTLALALPYLSGLMGFFLLMAIVEWLWATRPLATTHRVVATLAVSIAAVASSFGTLTRYEPFLTHVPSIVGYLLIALFTSIAALGDLWMSGTRRPRLPAIFVLIGILGSAGALWLNLTVHKGRYATLHLALVQIAYLMLGLGIWWIPARRRWVMPVALSTAMVTLGALLLQQQGSLAHAKPYVGGYTTVGQSRVVFRPYLGTDEVARGELPRDLDAWKHFAKHSGLPELAPDFLLSDYNVLLISIEATRFDQTSLHDPTLQTTPNLERLRDMGAFEFTRAYAPSSGTLHSMASIFSMRPPAMVKLETWKRPWYGRLLPDKGYVPELFRRARYNTFWVGHNYRTCFDNMITGFQRGFMRKHLFSEQRVGDIPTVDSHITRTALKVVKQVSKTPRRFFGWVFFVSPHGAYHPHYADLPDATSLDRYRQEIKYADEQVGLVIDKLEKEGVLDETIIIVHGDHGEEFKEHGGTRHKTTVYAESLHVPLLVRLPGVKGQTMKRPTSLTYLFPWLLKRGNLPMKHAADDRLYEDIGPMMARTGGAVVAELLGHDRMRSTLIYPRLKMNYDFISGLHQVYDMQRDPTEQHDLFVRDPSLAQLARGRIAAYQHVRAHRKQFEMFPNRLASLEVRSKRKIRVLPEL